MSLAALGDLVGACAILEYAIEAYPEAESVGFAHQMYVTALDHRAVHASTLGRYAYEMVVWVQNSRYRYCSMMRVSCGYLVW